MAGISNFLNAVKSKIHKPKIQPIDIQAAAGWGIVAAAGAMWVVQPFDWIKKTFIDPPPAEEK